MADHEPPSTEPRDPWLNEKAAAAESSAGQGGAAGGGAERPPRASSWERDVIAKLAFSAIQEQRRARRWSIFFRFVFFVFLVLLLFAAAPKHWEQVGGGRHTALVDIEGEIAADKQANADDIIASLQAAFRDKNTAGVIIEANSPGGSPVQAGYVNDEIFRLRKQYPHIPIYAVITDICASGCYYIVSAADKIYANKASIVGSIGVLMNGFGFVDTLKKLGVERRLITSGNHKGFMDPFSPLKESDVQFMQQILDQVHRQFINVVKKGRGERLKVNDELFSGLVWTGEQSIGLGLVDDLASTREVAKNVIKAENIVDYTQHPDILQRFAERLGTSMATHLESLIGLTPGRLR